MSMDSSAYEYVMFNQEGINDKCLTNNSIRKFHKNVQGCLEVRMTTETSVV